MRTLIEVVERKREFVDDPRPYRNAPGDHVSGEIGMAKLVVGKAPQLRGERVGVSFATDGCALQACCREAFGDDAIEQR